jgi:hypothetical protein
MRRGWPARTARWSLRPAPWLLVIDERDRRAFGYPFGDALRIPIRETYAAMRRRLGDFPRERRAMDGVALGREIDPDVPYRIVGPRFDGEGLPGPDTFEMVGGIVAVNRIAIDFGDLQRAGRRRLLFAADSCRVETN